MTVAAAQVLRDAATAAGVASVVFFIGILLAVATLSANGMLPALAQSAVSPARRACDEMHNTGKDEYKEIPGVGRSGHGNAMPAKQPHEQREQQGRHAARERRGGLQAVARRQRLQAAGARERAGSRSRADA